MKRRFLILTLVALLLPAALSPAARAAGGEDGRRASPFADVAPGDWYYEDVMALYELGLASGQRTDRFAPEEEMTVGEALALAARLRSLHMYGDSEIGPLAFPGELWYEPYVSFLQSLGSIGLEFEGAYTRPALRAEAAHILANALPQDLFAPINRELVVTGYANRNYITDVDDYTPYREDILLLYQWGILSGVDATGSFAPGDTILRGQMASMAARLINENLRIPLPWRLDAAYSRAGISMAELVTSDGSFHSAPSPEDAAAIDADVRYMLSRGERELFLQYEPGQLTPQTIDRLKEAFLLTARLYVEQGYNKLQCSYSVKTGFVTMAFSSSLYEEELIDFYREATMDYAVQVHDAMWADKLITADMSDYDKALTYFTWLCNHCRYDFASTDASMSHSGYRVFAEGAAVCDGYTAAYNLLLKLEGIKCSTYSTDSHIWTVAELDGTVCHIDTTWGDQTDAVAYRFFAMSPEKAVARFP